MIRYDTMKLYNMSSKTKDMDTVIVRFDQVKKEMGYGTDTWTKLKKEKAVSADNDLEKDKPVIAGDYATIYFDIKKQKKLFVELTVGMIDENMINSVQKRLDQIECEWGMIFNGTEFMLLASDIFGKEEWRQNPCILKVSFQNGQGKDYFKFLSRDNLFDSKATKFFCDVTRYKMDAFQGKETSWPTYESSIRRFVKYIAGFSKEYDRNCYKELHLTNFIRFVNELEENGNKKVSTESAVMNLYRHISDFMHYVAKENEDFYKEKSEVLRNFSNLKERKIGDIFETSAIKRVTEYLSQQRYGNRNLLMFYFCICFGFERNQLRGLKWKDFDQSYTYIYGKKLPEIMRKLLRKVDVEQKKRGIESEYVFCNYIDGINMSLTPYGVNNVFADIANVDKSNELFKQYVPATIRKSLVEYLFVVEQVDLAEIMDLLGIDVGNLNRYVTEEMVKKAMEGKRNKEHPMGKVLERLECNMND